MLEAGKENVGRISTRQECGDAPPRCNLASVGCGCGLRHTHPSPRLALPRLALCCPALVGGLAWLSARRRYARYRIPLPDSQGGGELYSVVTSWLQQ